jgi:hypothetical protein
MNIMVCRTSHAGLAILNDENQLQLFYRMNLEEMNSCEHDFGFFGSGHCQSGLIGVVPDDLGSQD